MASDTLDCAVNPGIMVLDTAAAYGDSEETIGQQMKSRSGNSQVSAWFVRARRCFTILLEGGDKK